MAVALHPRRSVPAYFGSAREQDYRVICGVNVAYTPCREKEFAREQHHDLVMPQNCIRYLLGWILSFLRPRHHPAHTSRDQTPLSSAPGQTHTADAFPFRATSQLDSSDKTGCTAIHVPFPLSSEFGDSGILKQDVRVLRIFCLMRNMHS